MDNDNPTTPYSPSEQQRIMRDLEESKRVAIDERDVSRSYYLNHLEDND